MAFTEGFVTEHNFFLLSAVVTFLIYSQSNLWEMAFPEGLGFWDKREGNGPYDTPKLP